MLSVGEQMIATLDGQDVDSKTLVTRKDVLKRANGVNFKFK